jgi:thioredoxin-related protein
MHLTTKLLFLFIFFANTAIYAQKNKGKEVLNIYTFKEVEKLQQLKPKPIFIFLYTDWCKICFGMKKTTFQKTEIIQVLNEKFYFVMLNGEEKKDIAFLGNIFTFKPSGTSTGVHELANELGVVNKRIAYPTTIILNTTFDIDAQLVGFYDSNKMIRVISKYPY